MNSEKLYLTPVLVSSAGEVHSPGGLLVSGNKIIFSGDRHRASLFAPAGTEKIDLPGTVIFPGFVNSHTHLAIPEIEGAPGGDFVGWLLRLMAWRIGSDMEEMRGNARISVKGCAESGITAVGDISYGDQTLYEEVGVRVRAFLELIGMTGERWEESRERVLGSLSSFDEDDEMLRPGISPHSLYSLNEDGLSWAGRLSEDRGIPCQIHFAESLPEMNFVRHASGEMKERIFSDLSISYGSFEGYGEAYLDVVTGNLPAGSALVHATFLQEGDLRLLGERGYRFIFCLRSNMFLTENVPLIDVVIDSGFDYSLGSDSRASCGTIDMFEELRTLADSYHGSFRSDRFYPSIFGAATKGGADAIGFSDICGELKEGMAADFCVMELPVVKKKVFSQIVSKGERKKIAALYVSGKALISL